MKRIVIVILIASLAIPALADFSLAEPVSIDEARIVAENWITLIVKKKGSWGGEKSALLKDIRELKRNGRTLGYLGEVLPRGYIIVPVRKEMVPVKAYSARDKLELKKDTNIADLIERSLKLEADDIERSLNVFETLPSETLQNSLDATQSAWDLLTEADADMTTVEPLTQNITTGNYQEGSFLLTSEWSQGYPYNMLTVDLPPDPQPEDYPCSIDHVEYKGYPAVGCVAVAAAQVMRHWNWPPYGTNTLGLPEFPMLEDPYDWPNMLDKVKQGADDVFKHAVAELCAEVGKTVGMDYGCDGSAAPSDYTAVAYKYYFRYSEAIDTPSCPVGFPAELWFEMIKEQLNLNRPIQYSLPGDPGHAVVVDGWQEFFNPVVRQFHINWGQGHATKTKWYAFEVTDGKIWNTSMITGVVPAPSLGSTLSGTYTTDESFPYRYFDQDAVGDTAEFQSGQFLQFLHGVRIKNTSTTGGSFSFKGDLFGKTVLYTYGCPSRGTHITNGQIKIYRNGCLKFPKFPKPDDA